MRVFQGQASRTMSVSGCTGDWFRVTETMGQGRPEDGALKGGSRLEVGRKSALADAMDFSDVRLDRVMQLRAAIAEGSYRFSAADVADRMVARLMVEAMVPGRG
jgi:anti-sigma28 factor (negative regulator of flagellin synthesis)